MFLNLKMKQPCFEKKTHLNSKQLELRKESFCSCNRCSSFNSLPDKSVFLMENNCKFDIP